MHAKSRALRKPSADIYRVNHFTSKGFFAMSEDTICRANHIDVLSTPIIHAHIM